MEISDLRSLRIFGGLTDGQLAQLFRAGTEVYTTPGMELFHHGEHADYWWVLIEGSLDLVRRTGREESIVGRMDEPGRWAGGFRAWDEHGVYLATGRVATAGRVLRVPSTDLRRLTDAWFPFGAHLVEGLFGTARSIESTARQRDALITLGTLAAGLAHEINNPAAAAVRAAQALEKVCGTLLSTLRQLADEQVSASQFGQLDALRLEVVPPAGPVDPLDLSDQQEALSSWLSSHGVKRAWTVAPGLAAAGVDLAWCERVAGAIDSAAVAPAFEWLASTFDTPRLLGEIGESTRRISELVGAVRSYSQVDRASMQHVEVTQGLESTLVMLGHKLKTGVQVRRRYGAEVPAIDAYAGELNQVWTNLIDNAIDAMAGSGTLRLTTERDGDSVVVEIGDDGHGMPAAVAEHAFDAFYTTKDVGKGTGLGLDIARRIVTERHGGSIAITSRPGDTVVRVQLPIRQPAPG
jgi:signal transduction histidine kinase